MQWLNAIVDELERRHPDGEIVVSSGVSPSGIYHIGHLREVLTADAVYIELKRRGRKAKHIHVVDDLDAFRKVPANIPESFDQYLGMPLCDIPSPDGKADSYADYFFQPFLDSVKKLGVELDVVRSHEKYRSGFFVPAIERVLARIPQARETLETISHRKLDPNWSPIQVMEDGRLKNRQFVRIDESKKLVFYKDNEGNERSVKYDDGSVKLDWRLDWPARWWLMGVNVEPFGRDHASKGGSYDTGVGLMQSVYEGDAPLPVPYDFINRAGDTKKMSASKGTGIEISEALDVLPPEVLRYFVLRYAPSKLLFFDSGQGTIKLMDDFAALAANEQRSESEDQILYVATLGSNNKTISRIPFSHIVASYQSALKDKQKTLQIISRTEHKETVQADEAIILRELDFIDAWLKHWAPEDVKFDLIKEAPDNLNNQQKEYLSQLAEKIEKAPDDADGEWFHKAIYEFKDSSELEPKELFTTLYQVIIGKNSGPRAGWFLSILPRDWLIKRLNLDG